MTTKNSIHHKPTIYHRDQHCISRKNISPNALRVMYKLLDAGHSAFLVGGSVRDLLMGKTPKDFDLATDAHPQQIKDIFKQQARIIGRRFRLVHIQFGREIIEVSTFRKHHPIDSDAEDFHPDHASIAESGQILRDNVYGTMEDDVIRRDFTVNALYYTVDNFVIYDYVHGMKDLQNKRICLIGDPETRFREDPVRLLRAIRFAAKLGFKIEAKTARPIKKLANLLVNVPAARLFDETLKLFLSENALDTFNYLLKFQLLDKIFPRTAEILEQSPHKKLFKEFIIHALTNTQNRLAENKNASPFFLIAVMLWPAILIRLETTSDKETSLMIRLHQAAMQELSAQHRITTIPRKIAQSTREIWELQYKLHYQHRAMKIITHPRFRAGYDFLLLREQNGEDWNGLGQWWTQFQEVNAAERKQLLSAQKKPKTVTFSQIVKVI